MIGLKRLFLGIALCTIASAALAGTSYDAITGQTIAGYFAPSAGITDADDTTLASLDPVSSVDLELLNPTNASTTHYGVTLTIYDTDPSTGLPNNVLTTLSQSIVVGKGDYFTANFAFSSPWTPTTADLYTGLTIVGGSNLGWIVPNGAPTVGTSKDGFYWFDGEYWNFLYFGGDPLANFEARYNTAPVVPEPASMSVLGAGALGLLIRRRKR